MIRLLVVAAGIMLAASSPANSERLLRRLVLRSYQPVRIALPDFVPVNLPEAEAARAISRIVASDLEQSGVFAPINPAVFADKNAGIDETPLFTDWRAVNAQELVVGRVTRLADSRVKVEFRLWETSSGQQLVGQQYTGAPDDLDRIAHMISADIYQRIKDMTRALD